MPAPREYTPQRRRIMQLVMWIVLAATVVVASVVARSVNRANRIELSPEAANVGDISIRLPLHWVPSRPTGDDPRIIAEAREPDQKNRRGRRVQILLDHLATPMSPLQYLRDELDVLAGDQTISPDHPERAAAAVLFTATPVGPTTGVLIGVQRVVAHRAPDGTLDGALSKDLYAATVLPSMKVLVVHLLGAGELDDLDESAVVKIAGGITLARPAPVEPADSIITLPTGIELQPPAGFAALVQNDPNRTDRLFWAAARAASSAGEVERNFIAVELVGCYFPSLDAHDPKRAARATNALQTLLLVRDPRWRDAIVTEQNGVWQARLNVPNTPRDGTSDALPDATTDVQSEPAPDSIGAVPVAFPETAYLLPDASGRALLAVLHGGWNGGGAFEQVWGDIQSRAKFLPSSDIAQLEDAGTTEAARINREDLRKLLADHDGDHGGNPDGDHDDQWFQRIDQSNRPHIGWSSLVWQTTKIAADVDLRQRDPSGEIDRIFGHWNIDDSQRYTAELNLTATRGNLFYSFQQTTVRDHGLLTTTARQGKSQPREWKSSVPAQYIPGQLLPLLMGELSAGPMVLKSESFLDFECVAAPEPFTIAIRPGPATQRKADGDEHPMRCVTAEVNGSGCLSRWYFNATGELESVELPAGVRRLPSDVDHIRFDFGQAGPMAP